MGITEETYPAGLACEMNAIQMAEVFDPVPVYFSKKVLAVDYSICINRIPPQTKLKGKVESGLYQMLVVGMENTPPRACRLSRRITGNILIWF